MTAPIDHQYPTDRAPRIVAQVGTSLPRAAADAARTIADGSTTGSLATLTIDPAGYPFGSVVSFALDPQGDPLFVISELAEHRRNLNVDRRASLLVVEDAGGDDPLAHGRVTLVGDAEPVPDAEQTDAVSIVAERVPSVSASAGYGDFRCHRLRVRAVRWVGGFGQMDWVDVDAYRAATVDPVLPYRHGVIAHMNDDHADAGVLLCRQALERDVDSATMHHVDRLGCDYVARVDGGVAMVRLGFSAAASSVSDVRDLVVELVRTARSVG